MPAEVLLDRQRETPNIRGEPGVPHLGWGEVEPSSTHNRSGTSSTAPPHLFPSLDFPHEMPQLHPFPSPCTKQDPPPPLLSSSLKFTTLNRINKVSSDHSIAKHVALQTCPCLFTKAWGGNEHGSAVETTHFPTSKHFFTGASFATSLAALPFFLPSSLPPFPCPPSIPAALSQHLILLHFPLKTQIVSNSWNLPLLLYSLQLGCPLAAGS